MLCALVTLRGQVTAMVPPADSIALQITYEIPEIPVKTLLLPLLLTVCASLEAQTNYYWKADISYSEKPCRNLRGGLGFITLKASFTAAQTAVYGTLQPGVLMTAGGGIIIVAIGPRMKKLLPGGNFLPGCALHVQPVLLLPYRSYRFRMEPFMNGLRFSMQMIVVAVMGNSTRTVIGISTSDVADVKLRKVASQ